MLLYEFEGKKLLQACGINVPQAQLIEKDSLASLQNDKIQPPLVLKAQVLSGKRADAGGIVKIKDEKSKIKDKLQSLFSKIINNEKVTKILVEEMVPFDKEYYISISYDTQTRGALLTISEAGGTGIEERTVESKNYPINILEGIHEDNVSNFVPQEIGETVIKLWEVFTKYDCELVEINPLVISTSSLRGNEVTKQSIPEIDRHADARDDKSMVYALDAKIILDDDADFRREKKFPERNSFGREPVESEIEARKIDQGDHRGTSGSVYWDLDGDIAVLAAGGGGSVVNMDALLAVGGKPANYTEHSGNPPREKLKKLTKIILSKTGLKGLWIVGGTANFTDIYETLSGVVEGLREVNPKPTYPIVIRRGGPRDKEAFAMLKEVAEKEGFDFHIFGRETPMTSTAKIMVDLAYKGGH